MGTIKISTSGTSATIAAVLSLKLCRFKLDGPAAARVAGFRKLSLNIRKQRVEYSTPVNLLFLKAAPSAQLASAGRSRSHQSEFNHNYTLFPSWFPVRQFILVK